MTRCQIETGQVGRRQILEGAGLEDHEEVRLEVVPVDLPQAGDFRLAIDPANAENQMVAELDFEAFGDLAFHRHARNIVRRLFVPPIAGREFVARRQVRGPGQAQVALDRPVAGRFLGDDLLHRLAVDADQASRHHRVQRCRLRRYGDQVIGEGLFVRWQDVQREVVWSVFRQLVLPGVQQLAAQQRNQRHRQQNQAERQGLARGSERMTQQLAQSQAPGQGRTSQHAPQTLQQQ
ncbi:hypothetical protein D3C85_836700 [compost metagenome]